MTCIYSEVNGVTVSGGVFVVYIMFYSMAVMVLQPALDGWGNRCRRSLCCLHQFAPFCVWPPGGFSWFSYEAMMIGYTVQPLPSSQTRTGFDVPSPAWDNLVQLRI